MGTQVDYRAVLRLHQLKGKIFLLYEITWSEFLILCSLKKIEEAQPFVTSRELITDLDMDGPWIYQHLSFLAGKDLIEVSEKRP